VDSAAGADPGARPRAVAAVTAVAVGWGTIGVLVRWVPLGPVPIVFARCAFAALTLTLLTRVGRLAGERPARGLERRAAVFTGPLLAVHWLCLVAAQQRAPLGIVLTLTYLAPVLVALAAPRLLGERITRPVVIAMALAVPGTVLLARPSADVPAAGVAFALGAAVTFAALLLVAKHTVAGLGGLRLARAQFTGAALVLAPFALVSDWGSPTASWAWLLVLGVVHTGLGWGLFFTALDRLSATLSSLLGTLEPVSAALFAWWFLSEVPDATAVTGGALVLVGAMIASAAAGPSPAPTDGSPRQAHVPRR
jgi:drug/metabolite transporter (DMT)-like permease